MKLLLDSHSFLWFINGDDHLSLKARVLIESPENKIFLSTVSLWEMAIKVSLGRLDFKRPYEDLISEHLRMNGIEILPITLHHISQVILLPFYHRDPFDRLLIGQAIVEQIPIIGIDASFDSYDVDRLW